MAEDASKKAKEGGKDGKRATRATSNVFAMFNQNQIQEFKEAFSMMDENRDGFIDANDLRAMYSSLGREPKESELEAMLKEAPDPSKFNFTAFLTLFGEQLHGTDPENTLMMAFKMFDEDGKDYIDEPYLVDLLLHTGDCFTEHELKQTWREAPVSDGKFDYKKMVKIMKRGADEDIQ
ncbi:myosin regulatory light chain, smooth muscle-like isoform X2 [Lineus longissimus]|uniref:myosin regulatory light chain, smooth muscle-like isoform X2 n=1 Tax=Lineus longissimus TaxID=88925 RepID=UPI00315CC3A4